MFKPQIIKSRGCVLGLLSAAMLVAATSAYANLFRYRDANGVLVISHTIPNDRVRYGYEIVDNYGAVIEAIPPQLSENEYKAKLAREQAIADCEKALDRVHKLYQNESDIDYAEQQGLASMDQSIANIRANLNVATSQREEFEARAAQLDVSGRTIPTALLDNIERAKVQERNLKDEADKRQREKQALMKTHAFDREVFALRNCTNGLPLRTSGASEQVSQAP